MSSSWLVVALALSVASFSQGKTANLVLLSNAPGESVRHYMYHSIHSITTQDSVPPKTI